jgi:uncharacterized membrane protein
VAGVPQPHRFHGAFGEDAFGRGAERAARFFGTPQYIIGQTVVVVLWIILNSLALTYHWDPYPFILLNLAFSTQAAYAAPLILLAETRQADRDRIHGEMIERHHETQTEGAARRERELRHGIAQLHELLDSNTELTRQDKALTEQVAALAREIRTLLATPG